MEQNERKYKSQMRYRKKNYKQFNIDFKFDVFEDFQKACIKNNTTPTTAIKLFVDEYIKKNK